MWRYAAGNRKNIAIYKTMFVFAYTIQSTEPLIIGYFINTLQKEGISQASILKLLAILLLLPLREALMWALHGPGRVIENKNAFYVRAKYKEYLLNGVLTLPLEWHTDHHSGDTIDKIEKGTLGLFNFSERTFDIMSTTISLLISVGVLTAFSPVIGLISIVLIVVTFITITKFDSKLVPGYIEINRIENGISAKIFDSLSNITTIIVLRTGLHVLNSVKAYIQKPYKQFVRTRKINEWKWFTAAILGRVTIVLTTGIYMISALNSDTPILAGTVFIVFGYSREIRERFYNFANTYNDIVKWRWNVFNAEELSKDFINLPSLDSKHLSPKWKTIRIENLSFSYHTEEGADLHLEQIDMVLNKGERIALIGKSGGGKTTFLKIVRDLYHPKLIKLSVDGRILSSFSDISDSISLIPQDPEIFSTTIRENITLGVEHSDKEIRRYTDLASFSNVINRLPNKLDSSIVEKGVNLSGGEKQRLALSRGLLASEDKDIILLDEPTSSVDFHNELEIYKNIFKSMKGKTIISSIHRLHLLSLFDKIYFFNGGKIIASGSLEELKLNSKDFQELWQNYLKTQGN